MENIFYATLALYIAGKPINKENIKAVLQAAGTPVDEPALDAMDAFVEALESQRNSKQRSIDPRIIRFLTAELEQRKVQAEELGSILEQLTQSIPSSPEDHEPIAFKPNKQEEKVAEKTKARAGAAKVEEEATQRAMVSPIAASVPVSEEKGRYVYGIAEGGKEIALGPLGLEGDQVYTIAYKDICAIVHNCHPEPYESKNDETVKNWARVHQNVLDETKKLFSTIIPLGFDTIIQPKDEVTPSNQLVRDWLRDDYERLQGLMNKIRNKDEYSVQISYEPAVMSKQISENSEEIRKIKEEMATKSPGLAYMYRQKLEQAVKVEMEKLADEWFREFYSRIKQHTDDIVVEKTKKLDKEKIMLLNLSCLVAKDKVEDLGNELEGINNIEGFAVRFTGPWPAYSFVSAPQVEGA